MKVSIIIPVYNSETSLRKCVESLVFGQEKDIEVILIEDCSQDNSWELCKKLANEYSEVKCLRNSENKGVSYTRNQGIKAAMGRYVLFVDSDDWVSGKYVKDLLNAVCQNQDTLIICGFCFLDVLHNNRKNFVWKMNGEKVYHLVTKDLFKLQYKLLLQQLWNKIFRRDIIIDNGVFFDETQSMGEDFQFVLDYIQAAQIKKYVIINRPLYYYIRTKRSSLMSKFGLIENEKEFRRLKQLRDICGSDDVHVNVMYRNSVHDLKNNYIYQICKNSKKSKIEKIEFIENIVRDGNAKAYYRKQQKVIAKENIVKIKDDWRRLFKRTQERIKRYRRDLVIKNACRKLSAHNFSVISQNCIGGVFYHDMHMKFLSPTINLFFKEPDFMRFVMNLKYYINTELRIVWDEEYPIGYLDDLPVYFMHYHTCKEAKDSWNERKKRINWNKIIVIATDMEGFDDYAWKLWTKIPYPKVLFTAIKRKNQGVVSFPEYEKIGHVEDLIPDRKFYKGNTLVETINRCNSIKVGDGV